MTSVVVERPISLHVFVISFDRLGRCFLTLFRLARATWRVQLDILSAFYLGWLAAPLTCFCSGFWLCLSRDAILAGGIGVARAVVGAFLLFVFGFGTIMSQCC